MCVEEIQTHVSKLNQRLKSLSNPVPEVSDDLNKKETRKELVSVENDIKWDSSCSNEKKNEYIYDVI